MKGSVCVWCVVCVVCVCVCVCIVCVCVRGDSVGVFLCLDNA